MRDLPDDRSPGIAGSTASSRHPRRDTCPNVRFTWQNAIGIRLINAMPDLPTDPSADWIAMISPIGAIVTSAAGSVKFPRHFRSPPFIPRRVIAIKFANGITTVFMMKVKTEVKCKVHKGVRICTVSTPRGRHLSFSSPVSSMPPVTMEVFTSKDCSWCDKAEDKLRKITDGMKNIVQIKKVDVDSDLFMQSDAPRVDLLPTIRIGKNLIVGEFDEDQVWRGIFDAYQLA